MCDTCQDNPWLRPRLKVTGCIEGEQVVMACVASHQGVCLMMLRFTSSGGALALVRHSFMIRLNLNFVEVVPLPVLVLGPDVFPEVNLTAGSAVALGAKKQSASVHDVFPDHVPILALPGGFVSLAVRWPHDNFGTVVGTLFLDGDVKLFLATANRPRLVVSALESVESGAGP